MAHEASHSGVVLQGHVAELSQTVTGHKNTLVFVRRPRFPQPRGGAGSLLTKSPSSVSLCPPQAEG